MSEEVMNKALEGDYPKPTLIKNLGLLYPTENSTSKYRYGIYKCGFCGEEFRTQIYKVKSGHTKSCGCYRKQIIKNGTNKKHNLCNTRIHRIWINMGNRVFNSKHKKYKDYGGRGITICDEWLKDIKNFYKWSMENRYEEHLTLDRIDNDGNYCPENCRWTTRVIQSRNTRIHKTNTSGYRGVSYNKKSTALIHIG
jgi:hypothetical protein